MTVFSIARKPPFVNYCGQIGAWKMTIVNREATNRMAPITILTKTSSSRFIGFLRTTQKCAHIVGPPQSGICRRYHQPIFLHPGNQGFRKAMVNCKSHAKPLPIFEL